MAKIIWHFNLPPESSREYIVAATTGLSVNWWDIRKVWAFQHATRRVIEQLQATAGCVGYALHATVRPVAGSTLSVWEAIGALRHFQTTGAHGEALVHLNSQGTGQFQYVQWMSTGDALPTQWEAVISRFKR